MKGKIFPYFPLGEEKKRGLGRKVVLFEWLVIALVIVVIFVLVWFWLQQEAELNQVRAILSELEWEAAR